jgi:hypothetical protein
MHFGRGFRRMARCRLPGETSPFCNAKHDKPALDRA